MPHVGGYEKQQYSHVPLAYIRLVDISTVVHYDLAILLVGIFSQKLTYLLQFVTDSVFGSIVPTNKQTKRKCTPWNSAQLLESVRILHALYWLLGYYTHWHRAILKT